MRILIIKNVTMADIREAMGATDVRVIDDRESVAEAISSYMESAETEEERAEINSEDFHTTIH